MQGGSCGSEKWSPLPRSKTCSSSAAAGGWDQKWAFSIDPHVKISDFTSLKKIHIYSLVHFTFLVSTLTSVNTVRGVNFFEPQLFLCYLGSKFSHKLGRAGLSDRSIDSWAGYFEFSGQVISRLTCRVTVSPPNMKSTLPLKPKMAQFKCP